MSRPPSLNELREFDRGTQQETQGEVKPKHPQASAGIAGEDTGTRTTEGEPRLASCEEA